MDFLVSQELHLLLLKTREELITAKVAKEHIEGTLKSEIMFLKDRVRLLHCIIRLETASRNLKLCGKERLLSVSAKSSAQIWESLQVVAEQQEKSTLEETLSTEISNLQEQLGKNCSFCHSNVKSKIFGMITSSFLHTQTNDRMKRIYRMTP